MEASNFNSKKMYETNRSHFANIVRLAKVDGVVKVEEHELLDRLAKRFGIEKKDYKEVFRNPEEYLIEEPLVTDEGRIKRLYNLTDIIFVDGEIVGDEVDLLKRIAIDIGFNVDSIEKITDKAIHLIINNYSYDKFVTAIKKINFK
jgi:uncharacterized tellurite resistance protein B-like protein